jgi:hypothetical protein
MGGNNNAGHHNSIIYKESSQANSCFPSPGWNAKAKLYTRYTRRKASNLFTLLITRVTTGRGHLDLLVRRDVLVVRDVETDLALHGGNLIGRKLGHGVGDLVGPLLLNVGLGEDEVNLLQVTTRSLGVVEPGEGETDEVDQGEEEVDTPGRSVGEDGGEHDDGEVGDPVGTGGGGGGHGTGAQGVDLGRVDPGERQRGKGEEADEQEDTDNGTLGVLLVLLDQATHGDDEGQTLASETDQEELAATDLLNHEEGGDGGEGVDGSEDTTQNQRETMLHLQVLLEQQS